MLGLTSIIISSLILVSCGSQETKDTNTSTTTESTTTEQKADDTNKTEETPKAEETNNDIEMQKMSNADLKKSIDEDNKEYVILDVRKKEDYDKEHVKNALSADVDETKEDKTKTENSTKNLKAALTEATGSETGNGTEKYALLCYSGSRYAQAATNILVDMGIKKENIYTVEGGYKGLGDDFKDLLVK